MVQDFDPPGSPTMNSSRSPSAFMYAVMCLVRSANVVAVYEIGMGPSFRIGFCTFALLHSPRVPRTLALGTTGAGPVNAGGGVDATDRPARHGDDTSSGAVDGACVDPRAERRG